MAGPKIQIVKYSHEAKYKVFLCNYDHEQKNHQLFAGGKLVTSSSDVKVYIVKYAHEADIKITHKNFPK